MNIAAIDIGFAGSGVAVIKVTASEESVVELACVRTGPSKNKKSLYKAHDDVHRCGVIALGIQRVLDRTRAEAVVCELPHGGGQSAMAVRCMALASGVIGAMVPLLKLPAEWYTPHETRRAATGYTAASKEDVIKAMSKKYPDLALVKLAAEREQIADGLATFEAARAGTIYAMARSRED